MNKLQKYLLSILGLQIILILIVFLLQRPVVASNNLIFPDLKAETVTAINISDATGKLVSLEKQGEQWVLPLQDDFPVNMETIQQLVEKLTSIRDNRLVTRSEASHDRLKISNENFERKVEITINGNKEIIYFGSSPATSNIHFRLNGKPEVYLTNALTSAQISTSIASWVDTVIYQISSSAVKKIEISNNAGDFIFAPDAESVWSAQPLEEGYQFDQSKWSSLLSGFTTLRFVEPVSKSEKSEYGLDTPQAVMDIEYSTDTGPSISGKLVIGSPDGSGNYYAAWSESNYIYLVPSYNAERFVNLTTDDYSTQVASEESDNE
ncbi:MAG: hypothetical protein CVU41_08535 [Chloroflexi bacterium HGW-Chloroflexi-3]|nr:MAG: hypothetical protein CVU41_08535 [Chloroflexi bacterium HGW-Chloroflexi-3]